MEKQIVVILMLYMYMYIRDNHKVWWESEQFSFRILQDATTSEKFMSWDTISECPLLQIMLTW